MKLKKTTKILIAGCIVGLSLLSYPTVSNYWNSKHATRAIASYVTLMEDISEDENIEILNSAVDFNSKLLDRASPFVLTDELTERYANELNVSGAGIMGYIEIKKLDVSLPIYHGTSDEVLQVAVGHLPWSSLPVGGTGTHCVLSGHRGLPSAKLFTDLNKLREGDTFELVILGETLTYEVDQLRTVLPSDLTECKIDPDKDQCTLVTCTPLGVNTHRLLVRGHRIETVILNDIRVVSEAVIIDPLIVAPVVALPFLLILLLLVMFKKPEKKQTINPQTIEDMENSKHEKK